MAKSYRKDFHGKNPYYDDFDPNKKFVRIMSRPGYPLQAREITQLQTILQNQIERVGDHFFEEGASVRGGEIVESSGIALRLNDTSFDTETLKTFLGKTIKNVTTGVEARVIAYSDVSPDLTDDNSQILFVNMSTSGSFSAGDTLLILGTLPEVSVELVPSTNTAPAVSVATNIIGIGSGIYYADGFFIETDSETIGISGVTATYRTFENPSASVGFQIKRDLISSEEDDSLKDPSFGFYNFNSPGADRYKVSLELSTKEISGEGSTFESEDYFEIMRVINGETTKQIRYTDYAIFEDTLARRTFDESGNYTVRPFQLTTATHQEGFGVSSNGTKHAIKLGAGKAYVGGYEFETIAPRYIAVDRGLDKNIVTQQILSTPLTNYVNVLRDSSFDSLVSGDNQTRETFTKNKKGIVQRVTDLGGIAITTNIGTCNIRTIEEDTAGNIKLYLFNINMTNGKFSDSTHIAIDDGSTEDNTQRYKIGIEDAETALEDIGSSRQIFKAPIGSGLIRASGAGGLNSSFLVKKAYTFDMSSGSATITSTKPFLPPTKSSYSIFYSTNSSGDGATLMNIGTDMELSVSNNVANPVLTITKGSNIPDSGKGTVIASQQWQSDASSDVENNIRTKTLADGARSGVTGDPKTGIVKLAHADVYSMTTINDGQRDVTNSFDLEVNSGIDAYRRSRIVLKAGATCAVDADGNLNINSATYRYFSHSGDGPFTVDSYPLEQIKYDDIPTFTDTETGETYSLADAYDFRPVTTDEEDTSFDNGSGGSQVVAFNNGIILSTVSYEHYLSRVDSVVLDRQTREFKIIQGVPAVEPKSPEVDPLNMNLGDLNIPPYTRLSSDIKYRYIDNQRTTMSEINELESTTQFDSYFTFKNDLEQEALNRAQNFRSSRTAFSDGIFVDTFLGHNNSITSKRDHNCSIDTEKGELRPAFESTFIRMGITGASLGANIERTSDNIYLPTSSQVRYTSNTLANDVISANQFSVADYLGTMTLSPSSDNFFAQSLKPKVIVNTVGEADNWETFINAYQRGRSSGFGSQWKDWESLWFGSRKRNDINIEHESSGNEYTNPRRSSYVSRVLSDKLIKKIGNKIVDLSVVPFANNRTVECFIDNLKPLATHYVYFDGQFKRTLVTDIAGSATGITFSIPSRTHLTGKKLVRISDVNDGSVALATSSADATYYAEGLLETKEGDSYSVRPAITRRKASNVDDVSSDYYEANSADNLSRSFNSQTPFAQEIFVDPTNYPNGITLKDVELFFSSLPAGSLDTKDPVKVHVRPMYNGSPHPFKVLPFSEVTKTDITRNRAEDTQGSGTTFTFSTPVYLKPNTSYAICVSTNADYKLWYGEVNEQSVNGEEGLFSTTPQTIKRPQLMGPMHIPLNNGTSTSYDTRYLKMTVNRCGFLDLSTDVSVNAFSEFTSNIINVIPYHAAFIHSNEQISDEVKPIFQLDSFNFNGGNETRSNIDVNTTIDDFATKKTISSSQPVKITTRFLTDAKSAVASMVDGDRLGFLAVEYMANNDDAAAITEELQPTARLATNRSRYVGRKVTLTRAADDIVVIIDGSFVGNSQIKVYVKLQGPDQPNGVFDDNDYEELFPEGQEGIEGVSAKFAELKPQGSVGGVMRFTTNNLSPGTSTEFNAYQIKILLMGEDVNNEGNASQIPVINTVSAVPLRRVSQDEIRRYTPAGSILAWAGTVTPFGFVPCRGQKFDYVQNPEYKVLFDSIGTTYNTGDESANEFRVPDLAGRVISGLSSPSNTRGEKVGSDSITLNELQVPLPPHWHGTGMGINFTYNNDMRVVVGNGNAGDGWNAVGSYRTATVSGDKSGNSLPGSQQSAASGVQNNNVAMITTWPVRPHPDEESRHSHGGGSNNSHVNPRRANNLGQYTEDADLESIDLRQKTLTLDYIIKI